MVQHLAHKHSFVDSKELGHVHLNKLHQLAKRRVKPPTPPSSGTGPANQTNSGKLPSPEADQSKQGVECLISGATKSIEEVKNEVVLLREIMSKNQSQTADQLKTMREQIVDDISAVSSALEKRIRNLMLAVVVGISIGVIALIIVAALVKST